MTRRTMIALTTAAARPVQASPSRFRKGICDVIFPEPMPFPEAFREVKRAGFDGYEITLGARLKLYVPAAEIHSIAAAAREAGVEIITLSVSRPFAKCPLNDPDPALRAQGVDVIRKSVDIARALGAGTLLLVPSRVGQGATLMHRYEDTWKRTSEELRKAVAHAASAKVTLTLENVWNKFLLSPLEMRSFVDQFRSPWVQTHFDIGNVVQFGYPQDWILTLGSRIKRLHVKDFKIQTNRFVPPLEGDVNWEAVVAALVKIDYRGWLSPEYSYEAGRPEQIDQLSAAVDRIRGLAG